MTLEDLLNTTLVHNRDLGALLTVQTNLGDVLFGPENEKTQGSIEEVKDPAGLMETLAGELEHQRSLIYRMEIAIKRLNQLSQKTDGQQSTSTNVRG